MSLPDKYIMIDRNFFYTCLTDFNIRHEPGKIQSGGEITTRKYGKYTFNISVDEYKQYYRILVLSQPLKKNNDECIVVYIYKGIPIARLNNMTYMDNCAKEGLKRPGGGKVLLGFIIGYLQTFKDKYQINKIVLQDNSFLYCDNCNRTIPIARLKMVTDNKTWYMNHGFKLYNSTANKTIPDAEMNQLLAENKKAFAKIKTIDIDFDKIEKEVIQVEKKFTLDPIKFNKLYKQYPLIQDFIKRLAKELDKYCCLLVYILEELFNPINRKKYDLFDFYQESFYFNL